MRLRAFERSMSQHYQTIFFMSNEWLPASPHHLKVEKINDFLLKKISTSHAGNPLSSPLTQSQVQFLGIQLWTTITWLLSVIMQWFEVRCVSLILCNVLDTYFMGIEPFKTFLERCEVRKSNQKHLFSKSSALEIHFSGWYEQK